MDSGIRALSSIFPDADYNIQGKKITNLGAPASANDALRRRASLADMPEMTLNKLLVGKGAGNSPAELGAFTITDTGWLRSLVSDLSFAAAQGMAFGIEFYSYDGAADVLVTKTLAGQWHIYKGHLKDNFDCEKHELKNMCLEVKTTTGDPASPGTGRTYLNTFDKRVRTYDGTAWVDLSTWSTITFVIDGGGATITTGQKGHLRIPFSCTINRVTLLADQSGSIVIDIWKDTYANFPPTDADSITAAAPPTISGAQKSEDSTLTGWTTSIAADDILAFNVDSVASIQRVALSLRVMKG